MTRTVRSFRLRLSRIKRRWLQARVIAEQRHYKDFAFIHIPKCGGTSLTEALGQAIKLHDTARERRAKLGAERWDAMYTFSLVRHPYERTISYYSFHQRTSYRAKRVGELSLNDWVREALHSDGRLRRITASRLRPCWDYLVDQHDRIIVDDVFRLED
ncbi:MAG: sulfotransferase family 2 domain-containing protein [Paracoccaceae bacterium]|nr:sulfotransferase family 2 domain-containing protein [Paracoccaceae bacterium]